MGTYLAEWKYVDAKLPQQFICGDTGCPMYSVMLRRLKIENTHFKPIVVVENLYFNVAKSA